VSPGRDRVKGAADAFARMDSAPILRRGLGSPALFGIVQSFTAASIYFGLGMIVDSARGWTWLVLLAAAGFFLLLVLSYVEGTSLHQERGGATVLARFGFNELWSFVAGWAILLDYLILIAITAFVVSDYVAVLWAPIGSGALAVLVSCVVIAWVARANLRGIVPRSFERAAVIVVADLALQLVIVALGVLLLLSSDVLTAPADFGGNRSAGDLLFAFTLAIIGFAGIDASSGLAGEVAISRRGLKRLVSARLLAATVPYVGIGLVAVSALPVSTGPRGTNESLVDAPMLDVIAAFDQEWLRQPLRYVVALSAVAVLAIACNAAMLGLSRLGYSLALNRQIPSAIGRLHPTRSTPVVVIIAGAVLAFALVIPRNLEFLAGIYAFGATLAFTIVHLAICSLRYREPDRDRPYKMPFNVRIGKGELPLPAALGALVSGGSFLAVLALHSGARFVGVAWMAVGITLYVFYRRSNGKPVFKRVTIPERALTRPKRVEAEYGSILVPVLGTPLDDDIMQTAGRLSGEEHSDGGEGGAVIEALWVFEVPMALPVDSRIPDSELKRARAALARAKAVGEEYKGVEVATATVRARRAGEAIVHEARRRGVEAIVLAAEEPTRIRGGALLGGRGDAGPRDTFVGETTRYVVNKAPCRVILTAPPVTKPPGESAGGAPPALVGDPTLPAVETDAAPATSR
jgi:APA family basic amino acid/polyamine antiporter